MSWAGSLTCLGTHQPLVGAFICYWIRSELLPLCRVGHCQHSEKAHLEMLMRVQNHRMVEVQQKMQIPARGTGQPLHQYCLGLNGWRAIFQKGSGGQHAGGTWALSVPLQQVRQLHIGQHSWEWKHHVKEEIFPFNQQVGDCTWSTLASYGSFYKSKSNIAELGQIQVRLLGWSGGWSSWHTKKGWSNWVCVARRREGKSSF